MTECGEPDQVFAYDPLNRLTEFVEGTGKDARTTAYTYDADGNRLSAMESFGNRPARATTYGIAANSNRLLKLKHDGRIDDMTYDAAGNLLKDGDYAFTYNARGRMASVRGPDGIMAYSVNGLGERIAKAHANDNHDGDHDHDEGHENGIEYG
jgi:YD repeat-containing protein